MCMCVWLCVCGCVCVFQWRCNYVWGGCFVTIMKVCVCLYTRTTYENVCIYIPERGIFIYWWGVGGWWSTEMVRLIFSTE